jgi:hypothetical protein
MPGVTALYSILARDESAPIGRYYLIGDNRPGTNGLRDWEWNNGVASQGIERRR